MSKRPIKGVTEFRHCRTVKTGSFEFFLRAFCLSLSVFMMGCVLGILLCRDASYERGVKDSMNNRAKFTITQSDTIILAP